MAAESVGALLASLTGHTGDEDDPVEVYGEWAGLSYGGSLLLGLQLALGQGNDADATLEQMVCRKLSDNGNAANIRENLLSTLRAGGAVGESVEQCLKKTGLTGWS